MASGKTRHGREEAEEVGKEKEREKERAGNDGRRQVKRKKKSRFAPNQSATNREEGEGDEGEEEKEKVPPKATSFVLWRGSNRQGASKSKDDNIAREKRPKRIPKRPGSREREVLK